MEESQPVVLAEREHRFAPPPWRMFDALVFELDQWVRLRPREVMPEVLEHERPGRVVWSSLWPVSPEEAGRSRFSDSLRLDDQVPT